MAGVPKAGSKEREDEVARRLWNKRMMALEPDFTPSTQSQFSHIIESQEPVFEAELIVDNDTQEISPSKKDFDSVLWTNCSAVIFHLIWIGLSVWMLINSDDEVFLEWVKQGGYFWVVGFYVAALFTTLASKFTIESNLQRQGIGSYEYLNWLCNKALLIPLAILGLAIFIALAIAYIVIKIMIEMTKKSSRGSGSNRSVGFARTGSFGTKQFVCGNCGNVKAGSRLNARCCGRMMRELR